MDVEASSVLRSCAHYVAERAHEHRIDTTIRGCWEIRYALGLIDVGFTIPRDFVVLQTIGFGSCHFEGIGATADVGATIGRSALDLHEYPLAYQIAGLDAVASAFDEPCSSVVTLQGSNREKVIQRSKLLCDVTVRALQLADRPARIRRVTMIGVLSTVVGLLSRDPRLDVRAIDKSPHVIGRNYHGVTVVDDRQTAEIVATSDVILVTGMSITEGDLDVILDVANRAGTVVIMYMQSGANLGAPILSRGAHIVISEEYPFYFMGPGSSVIKIRTRAGEYCYAI
ncbi:MAG: Rossmann-like domain-containing protein [Allosphingosinicella sp.]